jgi:hypothetical protein
MLRFRPIDRGIKLLPIDLSVQLLPSTVQDALSQPVDHELDPRVPEERYRNDQFGSSNNAPSVIRKAILHAYSWGINRSDVLFADPCISPLGHGARPTILPPGQGTLEAQRKGRG